MALFSYTTLIALFAMIIYWFAHYYKSFYSQGSVRPLGNIGSEFSDLGSGRMFDQIAPYYDNANKFMSLNLDQSWRRALVDELDLQPNEKHLDILDIATGTGDVAIMIAKELQKKGMSERASIIGLDPSSKMLGYAAKKVQNNGISFITLQEGNAEELSDLVRSGRLYDVVTISFGIRNFANKPRALGAIRRALKDSTSSKVCIMEFVTPRSGPLAPLVMLFLNHVVPFLGSVVAGGHGAEYDHLRDSIIHFPSPPAFVDLMMQAGLTNCQASNVFLDVVYLFSCKGFDVKV